MCGGAHLLYPHTSVTMLGPWVQVPPPHGLPVPSLVSINLSWEAEGPCPVRVHAGQVFHVLVNPESFSLALLPLGNMSRASDRCPDVFLFLGVTEAFVCMSEINSTVLKTARPFSGRQPCCGPASPCLRKGVLTPTGSLSHRGISLQSTSRLPCLFEETAGLANSVLGYCVGDFTFPLESPRGLLGCLLLGPQAQPRCPSTCSTHGMPAGHRHRAGLAPRQRAPEGGRVRLRCTRCDRAEVQL